MVCRNNKQTIINDCHRSSQYENYKFLQVQEFNTQQTDHTLSAFIWTNKDNEHSNGDYYSLCCVYLLPRPR